MSEVQETLRIKFNIPANLEEVLSWEDWETLERAEDGDMKLYRLRPLLARLMTEEDGTPMEHPVAMRQLARIPMNEVPGVVEKFMTAMRNLAVPKENGNSSSPQLTPAEAEFPDG